jgi:hypothetical protein
MSHSETKLKEVAKKLLFFQTFQIGNKTEKLFAYPELATGFI